MNKETDFVHVRKVLTPPLTNLPFASLLHVIEVSQYVHLAQFVALMYVTSALQSVQNDVKAIFHILASLMTDDGDMRTVFSISVIAVVYKVLIAIHGSFVHWPFDYICFGSLRNTDVLSSCFSLC